MERKIINSNLENPTKEVRDIMVKELSEDKYFYSPTTIHQNLVEEYRENMLECFKEKTLMEFISILNSRFINWSGQQKHGSKISMDSDVKLAEGEWNKYFQKAICKIAIKKGKNIVIYRWKQVFHPKYVFGLTEGTELNSEEYYAKINKFQPLGANSGLSVMVLN